MALVQIDQISDSVKARFWAKVDRLSPNECWRWTGSKVPKGYGRFTLNYSTHSATHMALAIATGVTPRRGQMACHTCDNPECVNPSHLFIGSMRENAQDAKRKGRNATGERNGAGKLTGEQIAIILAAKAKGGRFWGCNALAKRFGVHRTRVQDVANGTHVAAAAIRALASRKESGDA